MNYSNMFLPICYSWFVSSSPHGMVRGEMSNSNMFYPKICLTFIMQKISDFSFRITGLSA
jgi:hypothetical protein